MFYVFLGAPGAGKGTQAEMLAKKFNIPQISTGDLFREEISKNSEVGAQLKEFMEKGWLVPDGFVMKILKDRINLPDCQKGAIFDGVPRTIYQAEELEKLLTELSKKLAAVIYVYVPEEKLIDRLSGRWTCRREGHIYHEKYNPPQVRGICDVDGSELYQRDDQKMEAIKIRFQRFHEETTPLINFYRDKGLLVQINGDQSIENVHQEISNILEKY